MFAHPRHEIVGALEIGMEFQLVHYRLDSACLEEGFNVMPLEVGNANRPGFSLRFDGLESLPCCLYAFIRGNHVRVVQEVPAGS